MERRNRVLAITEIIKKADIPDQAGLQHRLSLAGIVVSQSSLSRDLKAMGVQRVRGKSGSWKYAMPTEQQPAITEQDFRRRFSEAVSGVSRAGAIIVLHTPPGEAQSIGRLIDAASLKGLLGTIAGDDTIFAVAASEEGAKKLVKYLNQILLGTTSIK